MKSWTGILLLVVVILTIISLLLSACGPVEKSHGNSNKDKDKVKTAAAFAPALSHALRGGRHVIEVPVDRAANTAFHGVLRVAVSARLGQEPLQ